MKLVRQNIAVVTTANIAVVIGGILFNLNPTASVAVNNGSTLLAALNGLNPLLAGERKDPIIQRTVNRDEEGLLGIPWRKRARGGIAGLLEGRAGNKPA